MWRLGLIASVFGLASPMACKQPEFVVESGSDAEHDARRDHAETGEQTPIAAHMQHHMSSAETMRTALLRGEIVEARTAARWLDRHREHLQLREVWTPYAARMHGAAHDVAYASTLTEAVEGMANMARACGDCHQRLEVKMSFTDKPVAVEEASLPAHGQPYSWAMGHLWEGMIGPSDARWDEGASILRAASFSNTPPSDRLDASETLAKLGARMGTTHDRSERSALLGEATSVCASCHATPGAAP